MIGKLALLFVFVIGVRGVRILDFKVPSRVLVGETLTLDCRWQLDDKEPLYRVSVSHGRHEFYRYTPPEEGLPNIRVFPLPELAVDISRSEGGKVVVRNVTTDMAGLYECEILTGPPRFEAKTRTANVEVFKPNRVQEPAQPQEIEPEFNTFTTCIQELLDQGVVQKEIKDTSANRTVEEVCTKYCDKTPSFRNCFNQLMDSAKDVGEKERAHLAIVFHVTKQLAQRVCSKSGDSFVCEFLQCLCYH